MLRRSHKKSKDGCLQCKRRHVKCDEGRPVCLLCAMSGRDCCYASQAAASPEKALEFCHEKPISLADTAAPSPLTAASLLSTSNSPKQCPSTGASSRGEPPFDEALNFEHIELLVHLATDKDMFNLGEDAGNYPSRVSLALRTGLEAPYVLYQMLAFSARHLAFLRPERADAYLHQAVALQTQAVSLFNATIWAGGAAGAETGAQAAERVVDQHNCVAVLLFSTVLGHHLLADTLARRDDAGGGGGSGKGLDSFLARYVQCAETHRGIHAVAVAAWPLLIQSELGPVLRISDSFHSSPPRGHDCRGVRDLVDGSAALSHGEREACRKAIQYLQVGFDAALAENGDGDGRRERVGIAEPSNPYQMIFSWMVLVPPEFTALLAARRPEAIILLAYYALLLHYGRSMWQVGDAGAYVLGMIVDYLPPEWHRWLEYPRAVMARDVE